MALTPFIATTVQPGEPLTAQAWNDLVQGIAALYAFLEANAATSLRVTLTNTGLDPAQVRVAATRDDGLAFVAVATAAGFVFAGLPPGAYTVQASAPGFAPASGAVTVPASAPLALTLSPHGAFMPALFGQALPAALTALRNAGIAVSRVLDITGRDVAPANPGADYDDAPVLMQFPDAGLPVAPEASVQLVVATSLAVEPSIEIPSLAGLTLAEAQKALEGIGLVLGRVVTKTQRFD